MMRIRSQPTASILGLVYCLTAVPQLQCQERDARQQIDQLLNEFHQAASEADGERYFALFAAEGVFLGTDGTERWKVDAFRAYAEPYFSQGRGWSYVARERHISLADDGRTAWFDEALDNENYGPCRGSGVWVLRGGQWKLAQYNLSIPIPNDLADGVVEQIRAAGSTPTP